MDPDAAQDVKKCLQANFRMVTGIIQDACRQAGRVPDDVSLMAVSKLHTPERIRILYELGQRYFGESYLQELEEKRRTLEGLDISWSFIGHLQSNKISRIVRCTDEIQALASPKHAALIARSARELHKNPFPVYIAVHTDERAEKSGIPLDGVQQFARDLKEQFPDLSVQGLMTVPPLDIQDPAAGEALVVPALYQHLKAMSLGIGDGRLSLGMSGDLRTAIAAGSHCVRIGTALFGTR